MSPLPGSNPVTELHFASVGNLARCHSCHPPLSAYTLVNPLSRSFCAKLALVPSPLQAQ